MVHFLYSKSILFMITHQILSTCSESTTNDSRVNPLSQVQLLQVFLEANLEFISYSRSKNLRFLSDSCEIKHCVECSEDLYSCVRCSKGYELDDQNCTSTSESSTSTTKQMKIIIIMAFISVPLILVVFCCFIYLFFKRKPQTRQRVFSESVMTEMQMAYGGIPSRSRANRESLRSGTDSFIGTGTNLIITSQNFETLFPVIQFFPELSSESCTVCFEEFKDSAVLRVTPCKHIFHHECLYQWLVVNDQKRCPNDNSKLC